ncbi:ribosomal protein small subunit S3 [Thermoplasma volcanium GSS1]|uniref:Small ribosomal subunit protein uS3 n=1 Tax=Thermoplasma volcanium (strain ATCC 51530 / DSM 4299 / JCM 9571 / NBRC 15438 / GSS1) TaxID=273116 RepID=RS3_THEVO|nr:30S ribosomal protein S3 [Thermoplasma volcanium]Q97BX1.1 RecName: Full=Small ribosomal subunit protein uS3; AltName: Full=30S ribosomal protein S3 [Thermoplasma volcanium GSS1]BAB59476.1 ribosomal protein small subunit S3 [Thermoplasma volcanium GSS1]
MKERKFVNEAVKRLLVYEYLVKETENAGFGKMSMKRTPFGTNITLYVNRPGLVIGRRGSKVQQMTETLEKKYAIETPQIEVKDVKDPDLNPSVIAKKIALSLEKGWSYRKAGNTSLKRTIDAGARGVLIKISGKISGERARYQKFIYGNVKYSGEPGSKGMLVGFSTAKLKVGILGVTVKILNPEYKLPDVFSISNLAGGENVGTESETDKADEQGREAANTEES